MDLGSFLWDTISLMFPPREGYRSNNLGKLRGLPGGIWVINLKDLENVETVRQEGRLKLSKMPEWGLSSHGLMVWAGLGFSPCALILISPQMPRCWKESLKNLMYLPMLSLLCCFHEVLEDVTGNRHPHGFGCKPATSSCPFLQKQRLKLGFIISHPYPPPHHVWKATTICRDKAPNWCKNFGDSRDGKVEVPQPLNQEPVAFS